MQKSIIFVIIFCLARFIAYRLSATLQCYLLSAFLLALPSSLALRELYLATATNTNLLGYFKLVMLVPTQSTTPHFSLYPEGLQPQSEMSFS